MRRGAKEATRSCHLRRLDPDGTGPVDRLLGVAALDLVADWPVPTKAAAVLDRTGTRGTAGPVEHEFAWASVTKLVTALTVLSAVRDGHVELDEAAGPEGSTIAHLLAHASGLSPADTTVLGPPERRRVYSNSGFEVLAEFLAERLHVPFGDQLTQSVLAPLGMTRTRLVGSPASGAFGPLDDLARLGRELLVPTLVPELMPRATTVAFPGLDGVLPGYGRQTPNDFGLGFEIRDGKSPHWTGADNSPRTFGHFGRSGSFVWVDPDAELACVALADEDFGPWAERAWPPFADAVLAEYGPGQG